MTVKQMRTQDGRFAQRKSGEFFEGFPVYQDKKGYKIIWLDGRDIKIHVFIWERKNGPKPKGHEIHHRDYDKGNYSLDNLELLTISDHQRIHAGWLKTDGKWTHKLCTGCARTLSLDKFYTRKGYTPSAKCKPCHCQQTKVWAIKNPEKRRKISLDHYHRQKKGG